MYKFVRAAICLVLLCAASIAASAQISTASMFGTVTDPTGAAIPKATVVLTQTDTGFTRTIVTNDDGSYRADFLPVGPYKLTVTAAGFKKMDRGGLNLTVTENAQLDLAMTAGGASETVEVTAEVPLVNTGNSTLGRTVTNVEIDNLPLVDRNVYTLLDLTPGVQNNNAAGSGGNGGVINPLGAPEQHVKINGSSDSGVGQVSYYLDGGSNMNGIRNTGNPLPNPDAIREFRVDTNNYSAQYGRNSSGVVTVLTKSGTNQYHGSVFEFYRGKNFNATTHLQSKKTDYNQHRFGFTLGGPVLHDKLFLFGSYAGFRYKSANIFTTTVPSAAMQQGNFSENLPAQTPLLTGAAACAKPVTGNNNTPPAATSTKFYACDPTTHIAYAGNIVPLANQDPAIAAILKAGLIPTPNPSQASDSIYTRRDFSPFSQSTNEQLYKGDYQMTPKQRLTLSYFHQTGDYLQNPSGNNILGWEVENFTFFQHEANVAHTWTISNNTVNQLMLNFTRILGGRIDSPTDSLATYGSKFAEQIPNGTICGVPAQAGCTRPQLAVSGWFQAGNAITGPVTGANIYAIRDVVSSTHGHHTLYYGGEANRETDPQQVTLNDYGVFSFTQATAGTAKRSSAAITDFIFGHPNSMAQDVPVYANVSYFNYGAFFQDDWRILPNLTLNLGVRYDVQTAPTNTQNMLMQFVPGKQSTVATTLPLGVLLPGDKGVPRGGVANRLDHLSPRVGFAWTPYPNGHTVIHAAAGLFYGSIGGNLWNYPSNGEPFSGRPSFSHVVSVADPYATDPTDFCNGDATCIAGGVGHSPYPFIYNAKNPQFVVVPAALISIDPNFKWPVTYQVNFGFQQQLTSSFAFSASYVASLSRKLPTEWDLNYPTFNVTSAGAPGAACADTTLPCGYANSAATTTNRRPYNSKAYGATAGTTAANPYFTSIFQIQSSESANYNALQVTAQQRVTHGISIQGFYVWSKTLDSLNLDAAGNTGNTATDMPEDNHLHYLDRQRSDYDQRHVVAISAVWKPHYGISNRYARLAVNGWTVTSIIQLQSGNPFNITTGADNNFDGTTNDRPNLAPGTVRPKVKDNGGSRTAMMNQWVDMSQFCEFDRTLTNPDGSITPACPQNGAGPAGSDGTVRQDTLDGPGRRVVAASIFREFPITERIKFQIRGESTNVFNLTNLPNPVSTLSSGSGSFGRINGAINAGTFGNRVLQVGGRILF
ncbi:MAG: carboxypeptidase regulatory-like domain-containing protein [Acidobacteriota bacterium]